MGRKPCCSKDEGLNRGAWTAVEDQILRDYINTHGQGKWRNIPKQAGLKRCGKSCRLRWLNYLRPDIKRGNISQQEEDLIIRLHKLLGNRWSLIAGRIPGRTDNEIKNYWNTTLRKKVRAAEQPNQHNDDKKKANCKSSAEVEPSSCTGQDQKFGDVIKLEVEGYTDNLETETQSSGRTPSITSQEINKNIQNYAVEFNFGELLHYDISDSDFWKQLCHFDYYSREAESGSRTGCAVNRRLPSDHQPVSFSEEILKDWIADDSFR